MKTKLQEAMKSALKAKDRLRLDTIRGLLSALQYEEMEKKVDELAADDTLAVLQREMKRRREELEFAEKSGRQELIEKLRTEITVIDGFLPSQLAAPELEKIITEFKNSNPLMNVGLAMKALKESYMGQYDAKLASEIARKVLA